MSTNNALNKVVISVASIACLGGCAVDRSGSNEFPSARETLSHQQVMVLEPTACQGQLDTRPLDLRGGEMKLEAIDDVIELDSVQVDVGEVRVGGEDPRLDGLALRDVRVRLPQPIVAKAEWSASGDAGFASFTTDLLLDWSLVTPNGQIVPLATQRLIDVEVELDVFTAADGEVTAFLYGGKRGPVWSWAGLVELDDLTFDLRAVMAAN